MNTKASELAGQIMRELYRLYASGNRGAMAVLRRCLVYGPNDPGNFIAYRYLAPALSDGEDHALRVSWLVAGLYAMHPTPPEKSEKTVPLPVALGRLYRNGMTTTERHLLDITERDELELLSPRLQQAVRLCQQHNIYVNYHRLLLDLLRWWLPHRPVQARWARQFYMEALRKGNEKDRAEREGNEA